MFDLEQARQDRRELDLISAVVQEKVAVADDVIVTRRFLICLVLVQRSCRQSSWIYGQTNEETINYSCVIKVVGISPP